MPAITPSQIASQLARKQAQLAASKSVTAPNPAVSSGTATTPVESVNVPTGPVAPAPTPTAKDIFTPRPVKVLPFEPIPVQNREVATEPTPTAKDIFTPKPAKVLPFEPIPVPKREVAPVTDGNIPTKKSKPEVQLYSKPAVTIKPVAETKYVDRTYVAPDGKVDYASLRSDMNETLTDAEKNDFQTRIAAAGNDSAKKLALFNELKGKINSAISAKAKTSGATDLTGALGIKEDNAQTTSGIKEMTDAEKLAAGKQSFYQSSMSQFKAAEDAAMNDLMKINKDQWQSVRKTLGLNEDGTPDLSNTEGQYFKSKAMFDDIIAKNKDSFNALRSQVEAGLGAQGKQALINAGLSGNIDPSALGLKMGSLGAQALTSIADAQRQANSNEATLLQKQNESLTSLLNSGLISKETYAKAIAAAKATHDSNINNYNLRLMEAAFGAQDVANQYAATNRTNRINTVLKTLSSWGIPESKAAQYLSFFNDKYDKNGNLLTPEVAMIKLAEWSKGKLENIDPQYRPTTAQEIADWKALHGSIDAGTKMLLQQRLAANLLEQLKATNGKGYIDASGNIVSTGLNTSSDSKPTMSDSVAAGMLSSAFSNDPVLGSMSDADVAKNRTAIIQTLSNMASGVTGGKENPNAAKARTVLNVWLKSGVGDTIGASGIGG